MGMDLIKWCSCKRTGSCTGNLCCGMVNEEADQLTTSISGGPDNRNFHNRISNCQNLMLFKARLVWILKYTKNCENFFTFAQFYANIGFVSVPQAVLSAACLQ